MPVTKTLRECYEVREMLPRVEWANITLHCWTRPYGEDGTYYCGEIVIHSSFGTWSRVWTACGVPFKQFLRGLDFGYAFGKFLGGKLRQFDGDASVLDLKRHIAEHRRHGWITKDQARALWVELEDHREDAVLSADEWVRALEQMADDLAHAGHGDAARMLSEPWELICTSPQPCAVEFWNRLWPIFCAELASEDLAEA